MTERFLSNDPLEVLRAVQASAGSPAVRPSDLAPGQACSGHVEVPGGVIHPAHRAWVLGCLELTEEQLRQAPLDFPSQRLRELLETAQTPLAKRLKADGVEPTSLVLTRVPVFLRADPPRHGNPIRSPEYAAWHQLVRACAYLEAWKEKLPPIIVVSKMLNLQSDFDRLLYQLRTGQALFQPLDERAHSLLGLPPPPRIWWDDPTRPLAVALSGTTVLLHCAHTVVQLSLESGDFSVVPVGFAELVRMGRHHAIFQLDGEASLAVYDLHERKFVEEPRALPKHLVRTACCGVELWNVTDRTYTIMPNGDLDSEVMVSGCGEYGWLDLEPEKDDIGVFSIAEARSVFQPWPHPVLERLRLRVERTDDSAVRALGRTPSGEFCFFYGGWLCTSAGMLEVADVRAANFDARAERFVCVGERSLRMLNVGTGEWKSWSLDPLFAHLRGSLLLEGIALDETTLMGTVGTVSALAAMNPETLVEQLHDRSRDAPPERELRVLISRAKQVPLQWRLQPQ